MYYANRTIKKFINISTMGRPRRIRLKKEGILSSCIALIEGRKRQMSHHTSGGKVAISFMLQWKEVPPTKRENSRPNNAWTNHHANPNPTRNPKPNLDPTPNQD